ncbi:BnaA02g18060D [Brassica napus]|uniref:(rape) hypothetical protein n=1 Tax=Brassica napus TaxID=3708 RepID=A0A078I542_BRANA|nr:unnamed protein product [Brassica napus]CDY45990.1 BnaA02g18060D [Brassica napus]
MADATKSLESLFNDVRSQLSQSIGKQYDEKLLKFFTVEREHFPLLTEFLYGPMEQIRNRSQESRNLFNKVMRFVHIKKLNLLLAAQPVSDITIVKYNEPEQVQYAYLTVAEVWWSFAYGERSMVGDRWVAVPGPLKNQLKLYPFLLPDQYVYPDITEEEEEEKIRNKPR